MRTARAEGSFFGGAVRGRPEGGMVASKESDLGRPRVTGEWTSWRATWTGRVSRSYFFLPMRSGGSFVGGQWGTRERWRAWTLPRAMLLHSRWASDLAVGK